MTDAYKIHAIYPGIAQALQLELIESKFIDSMTAKGDHKVKKPLAADRILVTKVIFRMR